MLSIYLAGAIEACATFEETHAWRGEAENRLKALGFEVICPLCDGEASLFGKELDEQQIEKIVLKDLDFVDNVDMILVNGTVRSEGTAFEIYEAYLHNKPVITFGLGDQLRTFVRYFSDFIVKDLDSAINEVCLVSDSLKEGLNGAA